MDLKFSREQITNALEIIQEVCKEAEDCCKCPFGTTEECSVIAKVPEDWEIINLEKFQALR